MNVVPLQETSREVAEARRRLETIVDSAMDAIITFDEKQNIVLFNPAAERMFGVTRNDAIGGQISRFIPDRYGARIKQSQSASVAGNNGVLEAISGFRADGQEFPIEASISQAEANREQLTTVILRDITERQADEEARLMLAREVDHRAKNALAVVQALVALTTAPNKEAFVAAIRGRVSALARAHSLLAQNKWKGAALSRVISDETSAYQKPGQIRLDGPDVLLDPNAVQPVSLIVHELATNAVKYGALSAADGYIDLRWSIEAGGNLRLDWQEHGGPEVLKPDVTGFGSTLITTVGAKQLGGKVDFQWFAEGIQVAVVLPREIYRKGSMPPPPAVQAAPEVVSGKEGRLLVVEDEALVALELTRALRESGWDVIGPAGSLEEAFNLLAGSNAPDAAVLDVNLNGEMVYPLADDLERRGIPFLFCSGYETIDQIERYRYSSIVRKPTSFALLMSELRRVISNRSRKTKAQTA